jgi:ribose 5-phosphate isomerase B
MIALGCDHGGYELKEAIKKHLDKNNIEYMDFGCFSKEGVDYPKVALEVGTKVVSKEYSKGILCCGTGVGISIAANKVPGIRAALVSDCFTAKATREHNDSNILCLGGRVIGEELAFMIIDIWLNTEFIGGRHLNRINQVTEIENKFKY